ncbi:MAG: PD-(D/E)XK nuclease family protein [Patescibacteria group bacterium]
MAFTYSVRSRGNFNPDSKEPFRVSRSKIDLFHECPRCFYIDQRLGIKRPDTPPFSLNNAVDTLFKKEFDIHRADETPHPLMKKYKLPLVPFKNERMEEWRDALRRGISTLHKPTNLFVRGGVDDVWVDDKGKLYIVDYKATSTEKEITLDEEWKGGYKRQMEVYQWLFRQNGFEVSDTGYFVYANGKQDRKAFDGKLDFEVVVLPYTGKDDWIEPILLEIKECLLLETIPESSPDCQYCAYRRIAAEASAKYGKKDKKVK